MPRAYEELLALPGVGPYTAGAVCAFAYNTPVPILETNIRTILFHHLLGNRRQVPDAELLQLSKQLLDEIDLDYKVLYPVVSETINKAFEMDPEEAQTGPARRKDYDTIDNHMEVLKENEDIASLYQMITSSIIKTYHP